MPGTNFELKKSCLFSLGARIILAAVFIYMGSNKVSHPVEFLKLVRQYNVFQNHIALNFIASTLPWFEIFCGLLLLLGIYLRGTAMILFGMLVPFTIMIFMRALEMSSTGGLAFCAIKFDCGCGAGEVLVCRKLLENLLLTALSIYLLFASSNRFCLREKLFRS